MEFLYLDDLNHQTSSLNKLDRHNKIKVHKKAFDSFNLKRVDGMKIDVEGHELQVVKGSIKTISALKPWLVIELNNSFHEIQNIAQWETFQILTGIGYTTNFDIKAHLTYDYCGDVVFFDSAKTCLSKYPPCL